MSENINSKMRSALSTMQRMTTKVPKAINDVDNDTDDNKRAIDVVNDNTLPSIRAEINVERERITALVNSTDSRFSSNASIIQQLQDFVNLLDTFTRTGSEVIRASNLATSFAVNNVQVAASSSLTHTLKTQADSNTSRIVTLEGLLSVEGTLTDIQNVITFVEQNAATLENYAGTIAQMQLDIEANATAIASIPDASTTERGFMTSAMVTKLNDIQAGAQVNPTISQSYSDVSTTTIPSSKALNDVYVIANRADSGLSGKANSAHGHDVATTTANGFMSTAMVGKLNDIQAGAQVNPTIVTTLNDNSDSKVLSASAGYGIGQSITALTDALNNKAGTDHTHGPVTASASGFVSPELFNTWNSKASSTHYHSPSPLFSSSYNGFQYTLTYAPKSLSWTEYEKLRVNGHHRYQLRDATLPTSIRPLNVPASSGLVQTVGFQLLNNNPTGAPGFNPNHSISEWSGWTSCQDRIVGVYFYRVPYDGSPGPMQHIDVNFKVNRTSAWRGPMQPPFCQGTFTRWGTSGQKLFGTTVEPIIKQNSADEYEIDVYMSDTGLNGRRIGFIDLMIVTMDVHTRESQPVTAFPVVSTLAPALLE